MVSLSNHDFLPNLQLGQRGRSVWFAFYRNDRTRLKTMKLYLIGGFLGSGKTTAIQQASLELFEQEITVGAIMNDQGAHLVDSQFLESFNVPTREVTGGCFCCNYDDLDESIQSLVKENDPGIIFAESVGSCTDIISTVANPLARFYPDQPVIISVFADARILPVLMEDSSYFFDDQIHYIYKKQLEEADILVVNKTDLLNQDELIQVQQMVDEQFPGKEILYQNSLNRDDIRHWLSTLNEHEPKVKRKSLDIDYDIYSAGEAQLGWLNGEFIIRSNNNAVETACKFVNRISAAISDEKLPVGHLKFLVKGENYQQKISFNAAGQPIAFPDSEKYKTDQASIVINARVQTSPEHLKKIINGNVKIIQNEMDGTIQEKTLSAFQPGFPSPTHRIMS
jgi:G3E family GTPase